MRISELAATTGLSIDTIRYYEKRGLLNKLHMTRSASGYRKYNEAAINRLRLVRKGQLLGLTLAEMSAFLQGWEDGTLSHSEIAGFFTEKIAQVDAQIAELQAMRTYLCEKRAPFMPAEEE